MPSNSYIIEVPNIGVVKVTKKSGQRSLRIRLTPKGDVLVSVPKLTPKVVTERFIYSKRGWIIENRPNYNLNFYHGQKFKSGLILGLYEFQPRNRSKLLADRVNIYINGHYDHNNDKQKEYIEKSIIKAMKTKAENMLLPLLAEIAESTGHSFNQAYVKSLQSRWGSCDSNKNIILNIFMLQLPLYLQKYVIMHELTHTRHMNHSEDFWNHLAKYLPNPKKYSRELKGYQTRIEESV